MIPMAELLRRLAIAESRNVEILDSGSFFQRKAQEMTKRYYVLTVQEESEKPYYVQFGDYNRGVVAAELDDYRDKGYKVRQLWILESESDQQSDIDSILAKFNKGKGLPDAIRQRILDERGAVPVGDNDITIDPWREYIRELCRSFVERSAALAYKGKKRDDAAIDYLCGAASILRISKREREARWLGNIIALDIATRGFAAVQRLADQTDQDIASK